MSTVFSHRTEQNISFAEIAQAFYNDERASVTLASFNNSHPHKAIEPGTDIKIPLILFGNDGPLDDNGVTGIMTRIYRRSRGHGVAFIEVEDLHFHHGSAVPCLSNNGKLLNVIADALKYMHAHAESQVLIAGHTDTTGDEELNQKLSENRGKAIKAIIENDEDLFVEICTSFSSEEDWQSIIDALRKVYNWEIVGRENAVLSFQESFNLCGETILSEDGIAGEKTWGSLFGVYQQIIDDFCGMDCTNRSVVSGSINWEPDNGGVIGFGEKFPLEKAGKDNYKSEQNRRVEIFFIDPNDKPQSGVIDDPQITTKTQVEKKIREKKKTGLTMPGFIDCHIHINSSYCAPLPLVWNKSPILKATRPGWGVFENEKIVDGQKKKRASMLARFSTRDLHKIGSQGTTNIGAMAVNESETAFKSCCHDIFTPDKSKILINLPMDMDLAHLRGYEGKMICEIVNGKPMWWDQRRDGGKGKWRDLDEKEYNNMEFYYNQLKKTNAALVGSNEKLFSFFHYDPRRWQIEKFHEQKKQGRWDDPFIYIVQSKSFIKTTDPQVILGSAYFTGIGFKMYTALGYKPDDPKLSHLLSYYKKCEEENIPIICHNTKDGMYTLDREIYHDYENSLKIKSRYKDPIDYFNQEFISPNAWKGVLKKFPKLRLCLAHFGSTDDFWGVSNKRYWDWNNPVNENEHNWVANLLSMMEQFENFYVDISYFTQKKGIAEQLTKAISSGSRVREKILFGTDWYMIATEKEYGTIFKKRADTYGLFMKDIFDLFSKVDRELIPRICLMNPKQFLDLDNLSTLMEQKGAGSIKNFCSKISDNIESYFP